MSTRGDPTCPHCGYSTPDPLDWFDMRLQEDDGAKTVTTCLKCGEEFLCTTYVLYEFKSEEVKT